MTVLSFPMDTFDELSSHLETPEQVAFMLAHEESQGIFRVNAIRTYETGGSEYRTNQEYEDVIRPEVIGWAWETGGCLIEAHSHGKWFSPVAFSPFDLEQLDEWVPHVRWRLEGRPYFAIVTAGDEVDGLAWLDNENPTRIGKLIIDGSPDLQTTGVSAARLRRYEE